MATPPNSAIPQDYETAKAKIHSLLDAFEAHSSEYAKPEYGESQARIDFIDKFWMALGWDVNHLEQKNPYTQEVRVEVSQPTETGRKRPDYTFYLSPDFRSPKFFVEAKKPSVAIDEPGALLQVTRYGWNAGLPIVVLQNVFEVLIVDTRYRPDEKTARSRIAARFTHADLRTEEGFAKLYYLFARQHVAEGAIETFRDQLPQAQQRSVQHGLFRGGYRPIDVAFLEELEAWRDQLARALKAHNPWMGGDALTEATQRILDRLVMIRFLEDKGIEARIGIETIAVKGEAWGNFLKASRQLDSVYNGIVFKHHSIVDGGDLVMDETAFLDICDGLHPNYSEYDFVHIPVQILGSVYERFLGRVIVATEDSAYVEDRPEVRKAGGVYYTPTHIVNYIVDRTLEPLVSGKRFRDLKRLRIVDPSCGSGSFLIAVFDRLIHEAAGWFNAHPEEAQEAGCIPTEEGGWQLSLDQKRELLVNCIYGMDLDHQAVDVAQLSLCLKLLEDESATSVSKGQQEFEQALLPSLLYNLQVGNALVDRDFYRTDLFPESDLSIQPTPFQRQFAQVFKGGGFHAAVGNPPYLFITELDEEQKAYFSERYTTTEYRFDVYGLFIERSVTEFLRYKGRLGFIIPHTLLSNESFGRLRRLLLEQGYVGEVVDIGPGVFQGVGNETMVLIFEKAKRNRRKTTVINTYANQFPEPVKTFRVDQDQWAANSNAAWLVQADSGDAALLTQMAAAPSQLGDLCTINQGLRTGDNDRYLAYEEPRGANWEPAAGGRMIGRYAPIPVSMWVFYDRNLLDAPRRREIFDRPEKIVVQEVRNISLPRRIVATLDRNHTFCLQSTNVIGLRPGTDVDIRVVLGVLDSTLVNQYFRLRFSGNNHIASGQLAQIPFPRGSAEEEAALASLVDARLNAEAELVNAVSEHAHQAAETRCADLDREIDHIVYGMYGVPVP